MLHCNKSLKLAPAPRADYFCEMKLNEKGRFAPPPTLPKFAQQLSEALASDPKVLARTHWLLGDETTIDGADFYWGEEELGHLHLDGEAHVAQADSVRDALIEAGFAEPFRWSRRFVVASVKREKDVAAVQWLFDLRRRELEGTKPAALVKEVRERAR